jgi:hypothetical protein
MGGVALFLRKVNKSVIKRGCMQLLRKRLGSYSVVIGLLLVFSYEANLLFSIINNLRPVADDYCLAGSADLSIFSYYSYWYTTFIADITTLTGNYFLIALPAVFLPYGVGTSVTFIFCLIMISIVVIKFLNIKLSNWKKSTLFSVFVFLYALLAWVSYWLVLGRGNSGNMVSRGESGDMVFFGAILNWQAANINYVILPLLALLIYSCMFTERFKSRNVALAFLAGIIVGGSFYVTSAVFLLLLIVQLILEIARTEQISIRKFRNEIIVIVAAIISISLSYFSPGAQKRSLNYTQEVSLADIVKTAAEGIFTWFSTLYVPAIAITLIMGAIFYRLSKALKLGEFDLQVQKFILIPLSLSLITFVVTKVSELFAYKAWWHELSSRTLLFIAVFLLGIYLMHIADAYTPKEFSFLTLTIFASTIVIAIFALRQAESSVKERKLKWEVGAAQVTKGMDPFDRETPWVDNCWIQLEQRRASR